MANDQQKQSTLRLDGECVLVTGATGSIGSAIARRLHDAGARVAVHYRSNAGAADALVRELGDRSVAVAAELSSEAAIGELLGYLDTKEFAPTMVVNNAADQSTGPISGLTHEAWKRMLSSSLDSVFLVTRLAAERWRTNSIHGSIVNIASIEGLDPRVGHAHYATAKAGVVMFTRTSALEYGPHDIRVNCVSPGLVHRDGIESEWPEGVRRWQDQAPLTRLGRPDDIAAATLFLLSPMASWISGANLVVDGGMSAQSRW